MDTYGSNQGQVDQLTDHQKKLGSLMEATTLGIMTLSIMTHGIKANLLHSAYITLSMSESQHN